MGKVVTGPVVASRRAVLLTGLASSLALSGVARAAGEVIAETQYGRVSGLVDRGVASFKGIPYGADTAAYRFQRSRAPASWTGVRPAVTYGAQSPQVGILATGIYASRGPVHPDSEDCLFLNVWTPKIGKGARPVMVWLHGGGFESGSGSNIWYDGVNLANRGDVVVVTINHRLNVFGFGYLARTGAGDQYADSGMVGMLDIVDALKWVRDNIAAFGGDPGNVTLFGESGGGRKISVLAAMPEAKGLWHRGIIQSGSAIRMRTPEVADQNLRRVLDHLGIPQDQAAKLAGVPAKTLLDAQLAAGKVTSSTLMSETSFVPVVDGKHLKRNPFAPDAPAESADVPLIIGWTRTETSRMIGARDPATFGMDEAQLKAKVREHVPQGDADKLIAGFRASNPKATPTELFFLITTGATVRAEVLTQVEAKARLGRAPVYSYCLDWDTPVDGGKWMSPHGLDIPLVFDTAHLSPSLTGPVTPAVRGVTDDMTGAWLAFARTGKPGTAKLAWPAYDLASRQTMVFDTPSRAVADAYGPERAVTAGMPIARMEG